MIKKIQALLAILLLFTTKATASADEWTLYPSYHNATYCEVAGDRVYVLASGALYSYDTSDNEVRVYDKITTLYHLDEIQVNNELPSKIDFDGIPKPAMVGITVFALIWLGIGAYFIFTLIKNKKMSK